jgi:hypothetical protein
MSYVEKSLQEEYLGAEFSTPASAGAGPARTEP